MIISQIAAMAENRVIAKNQKMPWHLPADLKYFKEVTWNHHVLMGRKNYEAEGKLLPGRTNVIITRQKGYQVPGAHVFSSIDKGIEFAASNGENELFIIGGGQIYQQTLDVTEKIYLTIIYKQIDGDTFFPELDMENWKTIYTRKYLADKKNPIDHTYFIYSRLTS